MTPAHGSTRNAVRAAIRSVQVQERAEARICPDCNKPLSEDLRARLTVGAIAKTGAKYVHRGRLEDAAELGACVCALEGGQGLRTSSGATAVPAPLPSRGASCWIRPDCPACHGSGRDQTDIGRGCPACWQAFVAS
jgi:hypothetical protein